jgi:Ca2+/H+ antiporter
MPLCLLLSILLYAMPYTIQITRHKKIFQYAQEIILPQARKKKQQKEKQTNKCTQTHLMEYIVYMNARK